MHLGGKKDLRLMSVGCGDGQVDLVVIEKLRTAHFQNIHVTLIGKCILVNFAQLSSPSRVWYEKLIYKLIMDSRLPNLSMASKTSKTNHTNIEEKTTTLNLLKSLSTWSNRKHECCFTSNDI